MSDCVPSPLCPTSLLNERRASRREVLKTLAVAGASAALPVAAK